MPAESPVRDRDAADFRLIETMRWEPAAGFVRLDRHLARLYASAVDLGFACDVETVGAVLATITGAGPLRVRLLLSSNGDATITSQPHEPMPEGGIWTLAIAATRLQRSDMLLRHKTTRRDAYVKARSEFTAPQADEVLLLNGEDELCEGTITSIFVDPGVGKALLTPPLSCGLLPGVLRAEMLDAGRAEEKVLTVTDLQTARSLFVGNSLRGLIPARLDGAQPNRR